MIALPLLAPPRFAAAGESVGVTLHATDTLVSEYIGDNGESGEAAFGDDDNFWRFRNILHFQTTSRDFTSAVRLDANLFHRPPGRVAPDEFIPGGSGYTTLDYGNDVRVERIRGVARLGDLTVTGGDFHVSFGRGMALSLIKLDDLGMDNALRGARIAYRWPDAVTITLLGGVVNTLNIDPITRSVQADDPLDRIAGARVEYEIDRILTLGAHGVLVRPRFDSARGVPPDRLNIDRGPGVGIATGGGTLDLYVGEMRLYLEGNGQSHSNYRVPEGYDAVSEESGGAAFGELSYQLSPFALSLEGIFYRRWLMEGPYRGTSPSDFGQPVPYHHMVTLEPSWMIIKSVGNAEGGRFTLDYFSKARGTQLALETAALKYEGGLMPSGRWTDHPPTLVVHPVLSLRQSFGESDIQLVLEGGFRHESTEAPATDDSGTLWHVEGDLAAPLGGRHSLALGAEVRRHELSVTEGNDYWVSTASLGYELARRFGVTAIYEFSDERAGGENRIGRWTLMPRHHYLSAMVTLHPPTPFDDLTVTLFCGSQRGGIKCAGGVCREYPDTVGARIEAVYRF